MFELEFSCYIDECAILEFNSDHSLQQDLSQDDSVVSGIYEAVNAIDPDLRQFSFFDLDLLKDDQEVFTKLNVTEFKYLINFSEIDNLENKAIKFIQSVTTYSNDIDNLSDRAAKIINRITKNIITASGYNDAIVTFIAYKDQIDSFPCWHIDKTQDEEINSLNAELFKFSIQHVFIVTLKGASTLFHSLDIKTRQEFYSIANDSSHSYGYDTQLLYAPGEGIDKLFNASNAYSAMFGQGSVHLSGRKHGAVHAAPTVGDRFLMIVAPGNTSTIKKLEKIAQG